MIKTNHSLNIVVWPESDGWFAAQIRFRATRQENESLVTTRHFPAGQVVRNNTQDYRRISDQESHGCMAPADREYHILIDKRVT